MKRILILLIGTMLLACNNPKKGVKTDSTEDFKSFDWLLGEWKQLNNDSIKDTFENWLKETDDCYLGHGFIMEETDTIWQERMVLSLKDSVWVLEVETPGNYDLVKFNLTDYKTTSFVAENPNHDFPKIIKYWRDHLKLNALVSNDNKNISFEFIKLE